MTRKQLRRSFDVCVNCGDPLAVGSVSRCPPCLEKARAATARFRAAGKITQAMKTAENAGVMARKRERGECYSCWAATAPGYRRCLPCRLRRTAQHWDRVRRRQMAVTL
jgi:predicted amidophosphoribosyltransferase